MEALLDREVLPMLLGACVVFFIFPVLLTFSIPGAFRAERISAKSLLRGTGWAAAGIGTALYIVGVALLLRYITVGLPKF